MSHHKTNLSIILFTAIFILCSTATTSKNNNNCHRRCGDQTVKFPFGFSDDCEVKLNCTNKKVKIGELTVQEVNSDSIFIYLPAKCNRSTSFITPLFSKNFAPTWNNSFLVQNCNSKLGGCVIPTSLFFGTKIDVEAGCDDSRRRNDNITCFTQLQRRRVREDVLTLEDWNRIGCKFLFSAIAVVDRERVQDVPIQLEVVELGWWLQGSPRCSQDANRTVVHLAGEKQGFRCRCHEGFVGDGFSNGSGCQRG